MLEGRLSDSEDILIYSGTQLSFKMSSVPAIPISNLLGKRKENEKMLNV
jgi:hypothetical protein